MKTIKWITSGKVTLSDIYNQISHGNKNIGLQGIYSDGFSPDGQHFSSRIISGVTPSKDNKFIATTQEINKGTRYNFSKGVNNRHYDNFLLFVEKLRISGIKVVIFFPPFASEINPILNNSKKIQFIESLQNKLNNDGLAFYDFTNPEKLSSSSCEFIDGIHPGIVTNAKMLLQISKNDEIVQKYINHKFLHSIINNYSGLSYIPNREISVLPEVDYLNIGCKK